MTANIHKVTLTDGREVLFSYGVIVAAFIPRDYPFPPDYPGPRDVPLPRGYLRTDASPSVTSSRHATRYAGKAAPVIPDELLRALVAPVTDGRR